MIGALTSVPMEKRRVLAKQLHISLAVISSNASTAGWKIVAEPSPAVKHLGSHSLSE